MAQPPTSYVIWCPEAQLSRLLAPHNVAKNHDPAKQSKGIVAMKIEDWNADWRLISFWKYIWLLFDELKYKYNLLVIIPLLVLHIPKKTEHRPADAMKWYLSLERPRIDHEFQKIGSREETFPSGKHTTNELENHHAKKMGKSTISTGPFSIVFCMFTRGLVFWWGTGVAPCRRCCSSSRVSAQWAPEMPGMPGMKIHWNRRFLWYFFGCSML